MAQLSTLGRLAHFMNKPLIGIVGAAGLTALGIYLRLNAHLIAWQKATMGSFQISAEQEVAIGQVAVALIYAGILIFVTTYAYWLFSKKSDK